MKKRGFTLVELMIVIAIIGVLAAIAIPNFNRARKNAKSKACLSNIRSIESAVEMYNMETTGAAMTGSLAKDKLEKYFSGKKYPSCPSGSKDSYTMPSGTTVSCSKHGTVDSPTPIDHLD